MSATEPWASLRTYRNCEVCGKPVAYIVGPHAPDAFDSWWVHHEHPADGHDAAVEWQDKSWYMDCTVPMWLMLRTQHGWWIPQVQETWSDQDVEISAEGRLGRLVRLEMARVRPNASSSSVVLPEGDK